ncbi:MAG: glycosyltransferase family 2 protein [Thainema sp.]
MAAPKFSIIMPTYNRRRCLPTAIASVLKQTVQDYELLIADDCSTDGTVEWLHDTYPAAQYPQLQVIALPHNRGAAGARNVAIAQAQGDWVAFLDSDDQWLPGFLEAHANALAAHPDAALSACDVMNQIGANQSGEAGVEQVVVSSKVWPMYTDATQHMLMSPLIWTMSLVVARRRCLLQTGLLNEALKICHDRELYLRLLAYGDYVHVPEALVIRVQEADGLTQNIRLYAKEVIQSVDSFLDTPEGKPYRHLRHTAKSRWSMNIARKLREANCQPLFAYYLLVQAFFFSPALVWKAVRRRL